nr:FtsX-like permease family protein [FCB group bacterium]
RFTDAEFWEIMDFKFLEGKPFNAGDVENVNRVAVINEDTRKKYFDGEPAVGKMIEADGRSFRVVGVVENVPILRIMPYSDIWVPITSSKDDIKAQTLLGGFPGYFALILAKDRSDFPAIKAELKKNIDQFDFMDNRYDKIVVNAETYPEFLSRVFRLAEESSMTALYLLVSILLIIFMLLPAVNLVNINVSRIIERTSEIGVRKAFGASSMTLVGQFIVENIILTLIGGVLGLIFTAVVLGIFNQAGLIEFAHFEINHRIFLISLFVCLFFGLFSGVYPAFRMSRLHPAAALKGGGR